MKRLCSVLAFLLAALMLMSGCAGDPNVSSTPSDATSGTGTSTTESSVKYEAVSSFLPLIIGTEVGKEQDNAYVWTTTNNWFAVTPDNTGITKTEYFYYDFTVSGSDAGFKVMLDGYDNEAWNITPLIAENHKIGLYDEDKLPSGTYRGILNVSGLAKPASGQAVFGLTRATITIRELAFVKEDSNGSITGVSVKKPTTGTNASGDVLPEVNGIVEGELTDAQASAFAEGNHSYVEWSTLSDEDAGKEPAVVGADGSFFDDFANGIDPTLWNLVDQAWGGNNNGVKPENVSYTDDGVVVLSAYGDYSADSDYRRSGACLRTIAPLGPGSFEVRMKVLPQLGTCTAMWTYYNDGNRNHEIDIELPGNKRTFRYSLFTNWITERKNTSQHTIPDYYHNDGEWHTYRFEWHTEPERIDYYVDDVFQISATTNVPTVASYFWVGVWFPQSWCGEPYFDTAHMLVDWVKYAPYDEEHEVTIYGAGETAPELYPSEPVTLPVNNYAAGGTFEYDSTGWTTVGDAARVLAPDSENHILRVDNEDSSVYQRISSINAENEYTLTLSAAASKAGSKAKAIVEYISATGNGAITDAEPVELVFDSTDMTPKSTTLTTPKGTYFLRVKLVGEGEGEFYFDDLYVTQPSRGDFVIE